LRHVFRQIRLRHQRKGPYLSGARSDGIFDYEGYYLIYAADTFYPRYSSVDEISCGNVCNTVIVNSRMRLESVKR
ncbi:MAG TPA: hypothetical protein VK359_01830, partial [Rubrobacteraceae bacterium]|nr:hypothetical protein [Rubrobacteraceae bacterium]